MFQSSPTPHKMKIFGTQKLHKTSLTHAKLYVKKCAAYATDAQ